MKNNLINKIAILTGITGGIGESIANKLIENNIKVIGLTSKKKSQQKEIFKKYGNKIQFHNLSKPGERLTGFTR